MPSEQNCCLLLSEKFWSPVAKWFFFHGQPPANTLYLPNWMKSFKSDESSNEEKRSCFQAAQTHMWKTRLSYDQVFIVKLFIMLTRGEWSFRCTCHKGARDVLGDKQKVKSVFRACSILKWQCSFQTMEICLVRWLVLAAVVPILCDVLTPMVCSLSPYHIQ